MDSTSLPRVNPYESPLHDADAERRTPLPEVLKAARWWGAMTVAALVASVVIALPGLMLTARLVLAYAGLVVADYMDEAWVSLMLERLDIVSKVHVVCRWVTAIFMITWMYKCHKNLQAIGNEALDSYPSWAIICWFVPIMNFFAPYQVVREIWWRSNPDVAIASPENDTSLVTCWWFAWLSMIALVAWSNHIAPDSETASDMVWLEGTNFLIFIATITAAVLLAVIVVKLNRRQLERFVAVQSDLQRAEVEAEDGQPIRDATKLPKNEAIE